MNKLYKLILRSVPLLSKNQGNYRHFTWILDGRTPICYGINSITKTHPFAYKHKYKSFLQHSEVNSIIRFPYDIKYLKQCIAFNIRFGKQNKVLLSKPCGSCYDLLRKFKIKSIYYTDNNGNIQCL